MLVCEHASNDLPAPWHDLGLDTEASRAHFAWDIGALALAEALAAKLAPSQQGAVLVSAPVSRLVYDLNRAPFQPDAILEQSEGYRVSGNVGLTDQERHARMEAVYLPFHSDLQAELARSMIVGLRPILLTIHSFTPVYQGQARTLDLGVIHDTDPGLAEAIVRASAGSGLDVRLNEPYSAKDGVTHTLKLHATPHELPHAMLEVRNDLLNSDNDIDQVAAKLCGLLEQAIKATGVSACRDS